MVHRRVSRHRLGSTAALALAATLLTGCAGERPAEREPGYGVTRPAVTIAFWYMPNGPTPEKSMAVEVARFRELHPNITVTATMLDWGEALTRLSTAASGGTGPDVAQLGTTWVGGLTAAGGLRPYRDDDVDGLGGRTAFLPASWTAARLIGRTQDTAVPWFIDTRALVYRTDVLQRLRLQPAAAFATWGSLEKTLAAIKREGRIAPLGQPGRNDWNVVHNFAPFIWGAGGGLLSPDGSTPTLSTPASVDGVDYYQKLMAAYNSRPLLARNTNDSVDAFAAGKTAVIFHNSDVVRRYRSDSAHPGLRAGWATAPMPAGPRGRYTFLGGSNLSIWASSPHQDAAYEWVRFLTGQESQGRYAARSAGLWPARTTAVQGTPLATDQAYRAYTETLANGRQYPAVAAWVDIEATLQKRLSVIWDRVATSGRPMPRRDLEQLLAGCDVDLRLDIQRAG